MAINHAGESVAELPVFDGGRSPASAMATEDTEIAFISRNDFHAFCMEHPEVALKMLAVVGGRLRRLVGIIEDYSSPPSASDSSPCYCASRKLRASKLRRESNSICR